MAQVIPFPKQVEKEQPRKKPAKQTAKKRTAGKYAKSINQRGSNDFNMTGHLVVGTIIGLFIAHTPIAFALVLFGSLLTDIDHSRSTLGKWNPFTKRWIPGKLRWKHRGHCHSIIGAVLLSAPFYLVSMHAFLFVLAGSIGHLLADKFLSLFPKHERFKLKLW